VKLANKVIPNLKNAIHLNFS